MKLNVLVLHNLEDLVHARHSALDHVLCWKRYAPENYYIQHRVTLPVTQTIMNLPWDVVILESTSLGICTFRPRELFASQKKKWAFLADSPALKLAFPQDDANHSALLDEWFVELGVDALYTVRPEHAGLLYPLTSSRAEVLETLSGYVDDNSISRVQKLSKPFSERDIEIGQRVTMYPPRGGRHARMKGVSAERVKAEAIARGIKVDISTDPADVLMDDDWYRFLGNCKFVLGAEGGLSVWDPTGDIFDRIEEYTRGHQGATFEEVEAACFPGVDGKHVFPGVSPRIFEAALMRCGLILVEGEYRGLLRPYEHYIPIRTDHCNLSEVFELMRNDAEANRRIEATYAALIDNPRFRYRNFVARVFARARRRLAGSARPAILCSRPFSASTKRHRSELLDEVIASTGSEGFEGNSQLDRILYLLGSQCSEALVHRDASMARQIEKYRTELTIETRRRLFPEKPPRSPLALAAHLADRFTRRFFPVKH